MSEDNEESTIPKILEKGTGTSTIEEAVQKKIYISYSESLDNNYLVDLIKKFLTLLGFYPLSWRDAKSTPELNLEIQRLIEESVALIGLLTQDFKVQDENIFQPSGNIPNEIAWALASHLKVVLFYEKGTYIPSNVKGHYCNPFVKKQEFYAELLINLLDALKKEGLLL